jgi:hypothetical protein
MRHQNETHLVHKVDQGVAVLRGVIGTGSRASAASRGRSLSSAGTLSSRSLAEKTDLIGRGLTKADAIGAAVREFFHSQWSNPFMEDAAKSGD